MKVKTATGLTVENYAARADGHYPFVIWNGDEKLAKGIATQSGGGWMNLAYTDKSSVSRQTSQKGHVNAPNAELAEVIARGWRHIQRLVNLATRHVDQLNKLKPGKEPVPMIAYPTREDFKAISQEEYMQWEDHCTLIAEVTRRAQIEGIRIVEVPVIADEFENWLKVHKLKNTSGVRARYAAEHAPRIGAPVGNKNAQREDEPLAGIVQFRCMRVEKAAWVRAARREGLSLSAWLTKVANESLEKK